MQINELLKKVDHTILDPLATFEQVKLVCEQAERYSTASACIPPCYVKSMREFFPRLEITTVIGFPNGYCTPASKLYACHEALDNGADELDMVINLGRLKAGQYSETEDEIRALKKACGSKILKVIVETCYLTDDEKIKMCEIVTNAGADFIKTSTGFAQKGACLADIKLFKEHLGANVSIKAAGGIKTLAQAEQFINAGCRRIGASSLVNAALLSGDIK